jgi:mannose-1-phosphate guanylyltransferase
MDYYGVIMAGGGGTRLWPLSRKSHPKQMLQIFGNQSLFQIAAARLQGVIANDHIQVVTTRELFSGLHQAAPFLSGDQFLLEPQPRGTASVVGLAAVIISLSNPQAVMAVLTADHIIQNVDLFQQLLRQAYDLAMNGRLVTLGIHPTFPATGYGYIEVGDRLGDFEAMKAHQVVRFIEKPKLEEANRMLAKGNFVWNSGMFFWRVDVILEQFRFFMPELYTKLMLIRDAWNTTEREAVMSQVWPTILPETIDYGIMEKASNVAVLPAEGLGWNDVGSWSSLNEVMEADPVDNIVLANSNILLDTSNSIIFESDPQKMVAALGVKDLIIIDTDEALMVCKRDDAQRIKEIVQILKDRHLDQFL